MLDELKNLLGGKELRTSEREQDLIQQNNRLNSDLARMKHREEDLQM
jgi:hypothetical protein